jgi:hypothetical protein
VSHQGPTVVRLLFYFFIFFSVRDGTQGLVYVMQLLYLGATPPAPNLYFLKIFCSTGV